MSKKDKLLARFLAIPSDFKYTELVNLLRYYGYVEKTTGKTSGSRMFFLRESDNAKIVGNHKPHGSNNVSKNALRVIKQYLKEKGDI